MTFAIKTAMSQAAMTAAIRKTVQSVDKDLPIFDVRTQTQQIDATLSQERLFAALTSSFGILALLLACVGIYGIMAYTVVRRTNEIGIRMALGAQQREVLWMVLRETSLLAIVGIAVGVIAALLLTRFLASMLFDLKPYDPVTIAGAAFLMLLVAAIAGFFPARRASLVDPMQALRHE